MYSPFPFILYTGMSKHSRNVLSHNDIICMCTLQLSKAACWKRIGINTDDNAVLLQLAEVVYQKARESDDFWTLLSVW